MIKDYSSICFVISPLGPENSEIRRHANKTLEYIIKPAVKKVGLKPLRADEISESGVITSHVIEYLTQAKICIADLTGLNPNVMYELGICHAYSRPVIQIAEQGEKLPFDIANMRTIFYTFNDFNNLTNAHLKITEQMISSLNYSATSYTPFKTLNFDNVLNDEQTRKIISLHQGSTSFRILKIIDSTLLQMKENPQSYNREHFVWLIEEALLDSRKLCTEFKSKSFGDLYSWFEKNYNHTQLVEAVKKGQETILENKNLESEIKRKKLLEYIQTIQTKLSAIVERSFREANQDKN